MGIGHIFYMLLIIELAIKGPESIRFSAFKLLDAMKVQLKGAPGEQVLVQVWDGDGNGDREMSNISETLDKCPRTKDTCQLSAC